jgi:hypothetical protein
LHAMEINASSVMIWFKAIETDTKEMCG